MAKQQTFLEIPKRARVCFRGQESFAPGTEYYSLLIGQDDRYGRQDYCLACWSIFTSENESEAMRRYWKGVVPVKSIQDKGNLSRDARAMELLKETVQGDSMEGHFEAFVLALYLQRRKLLALRDEIEHDGSWMNVYEDLASEEIICVKKIALQHIDAKRIQESLSQKLVIVV